MPVALHHPRYFDKELDLVGNWPERDYDSKLWFGGGDGMSFNNMLLVQKYMQHHTESSFQNFELMVPVLQVWHTMWTDIAKKIGRPAPVNLKKVDYYPAADLLALVHDIRMLDCWRVYFKCDDIHAYFKSLSDSKQLPSFEALEEIARQLFDTYTSTVAETEAAYDARDGSSAWAEKVPLGTPWIPIPTDKTSAVPSKRKQKRKSKKSNTQRPESSHSHSTLTATLPVFYGDNVLSASASFMRDASISRKAAAAVAEGAVGRLWETLKVMLVTFAGSGHSRYMGYLLEMNKRTPPYRYPHPTSYLLTNVSATCPLWSCSPSCRVHLFRLPIDFLPSSSPPLAISTPLRMFCLLLNPRMLYSDSSSSSVNHPVFFPRLRDAPAIFPAPRGVHTIHLDESP
ncbi:hypothetical protein B0H10DRAFT_2235678 [Mycena sp. CBHHK59/15]|nr:hypothetical protein B0H10DRAFT_2443882 [Mycena sp. CBHHK59/15]KAJ6579774.1 hypothetical protein B0H10DRAFT_2235678 [Mycena sp. CBHHK59/15]